MLWTRLQRRSKERVASSSILWTKITINKPAESLEIGAWGLRKSAREVYALDKPLETFRLEKRITTATRPFDEA